MGFDTSQESYKALRAIISERTDRIIAWVGSGISIDAGLPTWASLKEKLEEALLSKAKSFEPKEVQKMEKTVSLIRSMNDIWRAFDMLHSNLGDTTWRALIREALRSAAIVPTPEGYNNLWKLKVRGILNLNLDRLATKAYIEKSSGSIPIEFCGKDAGNFTHVLKNPRQFICNLHGHVDDISSWILTKSELKALLENPSYNTFINSCLTSNTIVFFGIKVDDIGVGSFLEGLTKLGIDFGEHYWVTGRKDLETDKFAERIGLRLIRYEVIDNDRSALQDMFEDLISYVPPEDKKVDTPAFINPCKPSEMTLPNTKDILNLDTESIRKILNNTAIKILADHTDEAYKNYEIFSKEYDEAIYRAWYSSTKLGTNILCDYTLIREVAYGAFGTVFLAKSKDGHEVALKLLHEEIRRDSDLLHSFRRGVRSMSILSQHNIQGMVAYRDASEIPAFVVMDWIDGPSLKDAIKAGQIEDWINILKIGADISSILRQGHLLPERVLHRDLRPSNIMLKNYYTDNDNWKVVVLDFDLSWHRGSFEKSIIHGSTLMGYLAPEQIQLIPGVSTRHTAVDSFGLGMTLFFMCSGRDPIPDEHLHSGWKDTINKAVGRLPESPWHSITRRFARLILKATRHNQKDRWDMSQIEGELHRLSDVCENPNAVESAELIAEEIAARCGFMKDYSWDEDKTMAKKETASGTELCIIGDESHRAVRIDISWGLPGVHGRGEGVGKWIPQHMTTASDILVKGGWKIEEQENKWAKTSISGSIETSKIKTSIEKVVKSVEQATDQFRFS
ncbi:MAG: protein kinase [Dehalococcoidales bacterium]|nr:protein kinase [Dehalococcoidales bacterium]